MNFNTRRQTPTVLFLLLSLSLSSYGAGASNSPAFNSLRASAPANAVAVLAPQPTAVPVAKSAADIFQASLKNVVMITTPGDKSKGLGSGFVIGRKGEDTFILTNYHVTKAVADGDAVSVHFFQFVAGKGVRETSSIDGTVLGGDEDRDIAVVKVAINDGSAALELGDSDALKPGDPLYALGNPLGMMGSYTRGVVSGLGRANDSAFTFIQTDAAINPGNSGGPLFNADGKVIGINDYIMTKSGQFEGMGFAIPINRVVKHIAEIVKTGKTTRGKIGLLLQPMTSVEQCLAGNCGYDGHYGLLVGAVVKGGAAEAAGVKKGDILHKINGQEVQSSQDITELVSETTPGDTVDFEIFRKTLITIKVKVQSGDPGKAPASPSSDDDEDAK